jgi:hypothetical protein
MAPLLIVTAPIAPPSNDEDASDDTWTPEQMDALFESATRLRAQSISSVASSALTDAEEQLEAQIRGSISL